MNFDTRGCSPITKLLALLFALLVLLLIAIIVLDFLVSVSAQGKTFDSIDELPSNQVGLLLGTSKNVRKGEINLYYQYRIDAAVELFNAGKVTHILVSGDNATLSYNEPVVIQKDLLARGVPEEKIVLDYAGFRTLDSIVRSNQVFGLSRITIITQKFHNERAIYIANRYGIDAIGFNARDVNINYGLKTQIREKLARVRMLIDLIFGVQPKFLGDLITIQ